MGIFHIRDTKTQELKTQKISKKEKVTMFGVSRIRKNEKANYRTNNWCISTDTLGFARDFSGKQYAYSYAGQEEKQSPGER